MGDSRPPSNKSDGSDAALRIVLPPSRTPSANSAESEVAPPVKPDVSLKAVDMPPQIDKIEEIKPIETAVAVSPALVPKSSKNLTGKTLTSGSSKMSKSKEKSAGGSQPPPLILMGPSGSQSASKRDGPRQQNSSSAQSSVIFPPPTGPFMLPPHFQSAYFNQQVKTPEIFFIY